MIEIAAMANVTVGATNDTIDDMTAKVLVAYYSKKYIFPAQFAVGVIGNILNLVVLTSRGMRTKTNLFLSAMAVADLCFFFVMFPSSCVGRADNSTALGDAYNAFYFKSHVALLSLANCFSAASIWLTVGVTVERLVAIKFPLLARTYWKKGRIIMVIVSIYLIAFAFSSYHFVWRRVVEQSPGEYSFEFVTKATPIQYWYVQVAHLANSLFVVIVPLLFLAVLNFILIYHLRLNSLAVQKLRTAATSLRRGERRASWIVVILIAAFMLFNLPSGVFAVIQVLVAHCCDAKKPSFAWFFIMGEIVNILVCTGKASNFWLYCGASSAFRKKLVWVVTRNRCCGIVVRKLSNKLSLSSAECSACGRDTLLTTTSRGGQSNNFDMYQLHPYHGHYQMLALCHANGHTSAKRRTWSADASAVRARKASTILQLQARTFTARMPLRERTCSAAV